MIEGASRGCDWLVRRALFRTLVLVDVVNALAYRTVQPTDKGGQKDEQAAPKWCVHFFFPEANPM